MKVRAFFYFNPAAVRRLQGTCGVLNIDQPDAGTAYKR